ncbi:hypothetical protein RSW78_26645, partial [Escherichia coli]|uniref:hypothetical protein n=1 Tax=Escherichia coli TaxID=562 RepID=UPI0028DE8EC9
RRIYEGDASASYCQETPFENAKGFFEILRIMGMPIDAAKTGMQRLVGQPHLIDLRTVFRAKE